MVRKMGECGQVQEDGCRGWRCWREHLGSTWGALAACDRTPVNPSRVSEAERVGEWANPHPTHHSLSPESQGSGAHRVGCASVRSVMYLSTRRA